MEFLPWKTINLDGAFRVTAPESVSEEILQEVNDGVTFRFNNELEQVRLEFLLNACLLYTSDAADDSLRHSTLPPMKGLSFL